MMSRIRSHPILEIHEAEEFAFEFDGLQVKAMKGDGLAEAAFK